MGDFKWFTSKTIVQTLIDNRKGSRKVWLPEQFTRAAARSSSVKHHQFLRHDNKPIELWSNKVITEKINYIHNNPVEEGLVFRPEDFVYSGTRHYMENMACWLMLLLLICFDHAEGFAR